MGTAGVWNLLFASFAAGDSVASAVKFLSFFEASLFTRVFSYLGLGLVLWSLAFDGSTLCAVMNIAVFSKNLYLCSRKNFSPPIFYLAIIN